MFEVETDKATLGFEIQDEVYVAKILVDVGSPAYPLGHPVAILVDKKDRIAAFQNYSFEKKEEEPAKSPEPTKSEPEKIVKMSPAAHNMIETLHIDPNKIYASGPRGLILKEDIISYVENQKNQPKTEQKPAASPKIPEKPIQNQEKVLAAAARAPRFSVATEIRLTKASALFEKNQINPFLIKTATACCKIIPEANSQFFSNFTRFYEYVDIQVFDYSGSKLKKYFIKDSQSKRINEIAEQFKAESTGIPTFAISFSDKINEVATPIPACLLSVGPVYTKVISENEKITYANFMKVTLNCDHRAVDGAVGANWLKNFKAICENPVSLL